MNPATQQHTSPKLAAAAVVVTHEVADYGRWKAAFDAHAPARKAAGIVRHHINRAADAPNRLSVYLAAENLPALKAFLASEGLKAVMADAGIVGPPAVALLTPAEDQLNTKEALAGVIVRHEVADYARWKLAFDGHASARAAAGVVGHAVNRGVENPNLVVVYLQAESLDAVRAFAASDDLKQVMQNAGIVGAPQIAFVQSAGWGSY